MLIRRGGRHKNLIIGSAASGNSTITPAIRNALFLAMVITEISALPGCLVPRF
jgi:hypothetical protein